MSLENTSFLVTGGAGFIGSHITETLLEKGAKFVRILDNLSTGKKSNIQFILDKFGDCVEFMHGDLADLDKCRKAVVNIDRVCHQGALGSVPRSIDDPLTSHKSNVDGTFNIFLACHEAGIKRVCYASSSSIYGDSLELPKVEDVIGNLLSPYAGTKYIDEIYSSIFTRVYEMECIGFRYFNVYGPRQDPTGVYAAVIPVYISKLSANQQVIIQGDGTKSRDFTYISNVVDANILGLMTENKQAFGEVFNIGIGSRVTIQNVHDEIAKILGSELKADYGPNRRGDTDHSDANIDKARTILSYEPKVNFIDGLKKTIEWFTNNPK